ncbi:MAG TPA: hypothetical protein VK899_01430 [Gemmatimonadales bacterium]|nr:hypothetical protein [Gemmatimonadales bacterium]
MKHLLLCTTLILNTAVGYSQTTAPAAKPEPAGDNLAQRKNELLIELQSLEADSSNLRQPLALASAKINIAKAVWSLDREMAKRLLREAFNLTLPPEEELASLRARPVGALPALTTGAQRLRSVIRYRALEVANRDKAFGEELTQLLTRILGESEAQRGYSSLAYQEAKDGSVTDAVGHLRKAFGTDPTQADFLDAFQEIAKRDRQAADALTLQYIDLIRALPLAREDQRAGWASFILDDLVFGPLMSRGSEPLAGPEVVRAWVTYSLDMVSRLEPAALQSDGVRLRLRRVWGPLQTSAPELKSRFLELEAKSRRPGEKVLLPEVSLKEDYRKRDEARAKEALSSDMPDARTVRLLIGRGEFDKARSLLGRMDEGDEKARLTEMVNSREAISLARKGDTAGALRRVRELRRTVSLVEVYPVIIDKCSAGKDKQCVTDSVNQAVLHVKDADPQAFKPPAGIPASIFPNEKESDPAVQFLGGLAKAVAPFNESLAFDVLREYVQAANRSKVETDKGYDLVRGDVFIKLAPFNREQAYQVAYTLQDRPSRIAALAGLIEWRGQELTKSAGKSGGGARPGGKQ